MFAVKLDKNRECVIHNQKEIDILNIIARNKSLGWSRLAFLFYFFYLFVQIK